MILWIQSQWHWKNKIFDEASNHAVITSVAVPECKLCMLGPIGGHNKQLSSLGFKMKCSHEKNKNKNKISQILFFDLKKKTLSLFLWHIFLDKNK